MRIGHLQPSRPEWYDRTPNGLSAGYGADAVGPHGGTTRFTYTAPSGRKVWIESARALLSRAATATTAGRASFEVQVRSPTLTYVHGLVRVEAYSSVVGSGDSQVLGAGGVVNAGWTIIGTTADAATGGSINYSGGVKLVEFDA